MFKNEIVFESNMCNRSDFLVQVLVKKNSNFIHKAFSKGPYSKLFKATLGGGLENAG